MITMNQDYIENSKVFAVIKDHTAPGLSGLLTKRPDVDGCMVLEYEGSYSVVWDFRAFGRSQKWSKDKAMALFYYLQEGMAAMVNDGTVYFCNEDLNKFWEQR